MGEGRDDLVRIGADGVARPVGSGSSLHMQTREGSWRVLPAPPGLVVMRRADGGGDLRNRACLLSGEILAAGTVGDVVSHIGNAGLKGELLLLAPTASRSVFCDQGRVTGVESTVPSEHLGELLYRFGLVGEEQLYACSEEAAAASIRIGEAAIRLGFVARERVMGLLAKQAEEVFFAMMQTGEGMFYFLDGYDASSMPFPQALSIGTLVRESVKRMHETSFFRSRIPSDRHVPARVPGCAAPAGDDGSVFSLIDGQRSISDLCRALGQGDFDVSRAVFQLVRSGHVSIEPPHVAPEVAVDVCNRAVALILRELDAMDQGDSVREQLSAYAAEPRVQAQLFAGAGPADDGTFDAQKVVANLSNWQSSTEAGEMLPAWLHEYATHALSLAQPLVRRREQAQVAPEFGEARPKLSQRVARILDPITPRSHDREGTASAHAPSR